MPLIDDVGVLRPRDPMQNTVLRRVPPERWPHWTAELTHVHLDLGHTLYEPGQPIRHIHFPLTCVVSTETVLASGHGTQVAMIGFEGLIGMPGLLAGVSATLRAEVLCAGDAVRMDVGWINAEMHRSPLVLSTLHRNLHAVMVQLAQTATCRRHHTPEEQLCCLLLRTSDRARSNDLHLTHDQLAQLLGLRRETVTQAASKMQHKGMLSYRRGRLHIADRPALQSSSCECYLAVNRAYEILMGIPPARD